MSFQLKWDADLTFLNSFNIATIISDYVDLKNKYKSVILDTQKHFVFINLITQ